MRFVKRVDDQILEALNSTDPATVALVIII